MFNDNADVVASRAVTETVSTFRASMVGMAFEPTSRASAWGAGTASAVELTLGAGTIDRASVLRIESLLAEGRKVANKADPLRRWIVAATASRRLRRSREVSAACRRAGEVLAEIDRLRELPLTSARQLDHVVNVALDHFVEAFKYLASKFMAHIEALKAALLAACSAETEYPTGAMSPAQFSVLPRAVTQPDLALAPPSRFTAPCAQVDWLAA